MTKKARANQKGRMTATERQVLCLAAVKKGRQTLLEITEYVLSNMAADYAPKEPTRYSEYISEDLKTLADLNQVIGVQTDIDGNLPDEPEDAGTGRWRYWRYSLPGGDAEGEVHIMRFGGSFKHIGTNVSWLVSALPSSLGNAKNIITLESLDHRRYFTLTLSKNEVPVDLVIAQASKEQEISWKENENNLHRRSSLLALPYESLSHTRGQRFGHAVISWDKAGAATINDMGTFHGTYILDPVPVGMYKALDITRQLVGAKARVETNMHIFDWKRIPPNVETVVPQGGLIRLGNWFAQLGTK